MRRLPIQLRLRTLLGLIVCFALGSWAWVTYLGPLPRWYRKILSDNESPARWEAAAQGISGRVIGVDRDEAASALCMALYDPSPRVRETAAYSLRDAGPEARALVPHLVRALTDTSFPVRWQAAQSLGFVVGRDDEAKKIAVPGLVLALKDKEVDVRIAAGLSLALMGQGESAVPVMTSAIREGRDKSGEAQLARRS